MRILIVVVFTLSMAISALMILPTTCSGFGGDVVYDPANYSQNVMTAARALKTNVQQAQQIAFQVRQLEMQTRSLMKLPVDYWQRSQQAWEQLSMLAKSNANLGQFLTKIDTEFTRLYPGYQAVENSVDAYKSWTANSLESSKAVIKLAEEQRKLFDGVAESNRAAVEQNMSPAGELQVMQVQTQIAASVVTELQKISQLQSQTSVLQATYLAGQVQGQAVRQKAMDDWIESSKAYKYH